MVDITSITGVKHGETLALDQLVSGGEPPTMKLYEMIGVVSGGISYKKHKNLGV